MFGTKNLVLLACVMVLFACDGREPEPLETTSKPARPPRPAFERGLAAPVPETYVTERVREAAARLNKSDAGKVVLSSIDAHGGLRDWYGRGTMEFTFNYRPEGEPERKMHTRQKVDLWRSHARHREVGAGADAEFAFDGKNAWITPGPDAFPSSARFWSLTPYYFVAMPFVLADPGVILEKLEDAELDGEVFDRVKASYEPGIGDAPDDYYVLYIGKEDKRVRALRYIVSYPGFFLKGEHAPEKLMHFDRFRDHKPVMAQQLDTYAWNPTTQKPGELRTKIEVTYHAFGETFDEDWLKAPAGAVVTRSVPRKKPAPRKKADAAEKSRVKPSEALSSQPESNEK